MRNDKFVLQDGGTIISIPKGAIMRTWNHETSKLHLIFQFQKVRLWVAFRIGKQRQSKISIPKGAIMREMQKAEQRPTLISIPKGAIMSRFLFATCALR